VARYRNVVVGCVPVRNTVSPPTWKSVMLSLLKSTVKLPQGPVPSRLSSKPTLPLLTSHSSGSCVSYVAGQFSKKCAEVNEASSSELRSEAIGAMANVGSATCENVE
jgi:hypothetical protein